MFVTLFSYKIQMLYIQTNNTYLNVTLRKKANIVFSFQTSNKKTNASFFYYNEFCALINYSQKRKEIGLVVWGILKTNSALLI